MKLKRIWAITLRNLYDMKHNWARIADIFFWPMIDMLIWGFMTMFLIRSQNTFLVFASAILGGIILWSLYFRVQQDIGFSFITEVWERNVLNLFSSPLTVKEYFLGTMLLGLIKLFISALGMTAASYTFFEFNLFSSGPILFLLLSNLILTGWAVGMLTVALVLRYGTKAEYMVWWLPFLLQPFSAVAYPLKLLPPWMQAIGFMLPTTHVFEGLRNLILDGHISFYNLTLATALNLLYLLLATIFFWKILKVVRAKGLLAKIS